MKGLLIVNQFVNSDKFTEIYQMLQNAAKGLDIQLTLKKSGELLHNISCLRQLSCDFILFWDKDILLAKMLEACGYPVFNSADAIFYCDNKGYTELILQQNGIRTPLTFIAPLTYERYGYSPSSFADEIIDRALVAAYETAGKPQLMLMYSDDLVAAGRNAGKDIRVNVVGDRVVSAMLRYSVNGDFRSNITNGGHMKPFEPNDRQKSVAVSACRALGLDFAGVDILFGKDDEPIVCEVNSNPHFKSSLDCTGVDMSPLILSHIKERVQKR